MGIMENNKNDLLENKSKHEFKSNSLGLNTDEAISYDLSTDIVVMKKNLVFEKNIYKKTQDEQLELFMNPVKKRINANINPLNENSYETLTNVQINSSGVVTDLTDNNLNFNKNYMVTSELNAGDKVNINYVKPTKFNTVKYIESNAIVATNNTQLNSVELDNTAILLDADNFNESVESGNYAIYHDSEDIRINFKIIGDDNNIGLYFDFIKINDNLLSNDNINIINLIKTVLFLNDTGYMSILDNSF